MKDYHSATQGSVVRKCFHQKSGLYVSEAVSPKNDFEKVGCVVTKLASGRLIHMDRKCPYI